jgi:ABC-type glutathione transport system ATPase component
LEIDQTERFQSLDQSTQDGIHAILMIQDSMTLEIRHQADIVLGSSRQDHIKTRDVTQRGHNQILEALHQLNPPEHDKQKTTISQTPYAAENRARDTLLYTLAFEVMTDRLEQINNSYKETFEWVYEEPKTSTRPWSNFSSWLKASNSDLYWINGKAGSGKSTLMNFLSDHDKTNALLSFWCGGESLSRQASFSGTVGLHYSGLKKASSDHFYTRS